MDQLNLIPINERDTDLSKLSIADDGPVTQHREEEEIIFSNPQNNHPTLEIIEIEMPKAPEHTRKHKYSDSSSHFDNFQIKVCNRLDKSNNNYQFCYLD